MPGGEPSPWNEEPRGWTPGPAIFALGLSFLICEWGRTLPLFLRETALAGGGRWGGRSWKLWGVTMVREAGTLWLGVEGRG